MQGNMDFTVLETACDPSDEITLSNKTNTDLDPDVLDITNQNTDEIEEPEETDELIAKGSLPKILLWKYCRAGASSLGLFITALLIIVVELCGIGIFYWLGYWTRQAELRIRAAKESVVENNASPFLEPETINISIIEKNMTKDLVNKMSSSNLEYLSTETALWVYGFLVLSFAIAAAVKNIILFRIFVHSSCDMHNSMFSSLLNAPMRFFDTNPAGRILNRFSKDTGVIDNLLPENLHLMIQIFGVIGGALVLVLSTNWWIIIPIQVVVYIFWKVKAVYMPTAQSLWRLEAAAKSPIFSHVNSSVSGLTTIRSCKAEELVREEFDSLQNTHTGANFLTIASADAFVLWLDFSSVAFLASIMFSFIVIDDGSTFAANVGLALSQILNVCGRLDMGIYLISSTVEKMISVERINQFTKLDKEGPFESTIDQKPPVDWPVKGQVKFENVFLRYSESAEPVLKNLSFTIESGMKVGIMGRTGAGKSSLVSALLRLANLEGTIYLDGVDTSKIGLHDLRRRISIIPQEPMLFCATLRDNLDPLHEFDDAALWSALEIVELRTSVSGLDHLVSHNGDNFSAGQKQLLCLARAIICRNKLLVLDEATANVDAKTDELIRKTIKSEFKECTVLTIAHRLDTIMDNDKVLVLDHGEIVGFDHPRILLHKNEAYFTKLVLGTGISMAEKLQLKRDNNGAIKETKC